MTEFANFPVFGSKDEHGEVLSKLARRITFVEDIFDTDAASPSFVSLMTLTLSQTVRAAKAMFSEVRHLRFFGNEFLLTKRDDMRNY